MFLGIASDLWTKSVAFERIAEDPVVIYREDVLAVGPARIGSLIPRHDPVVVVPGVLELTLVLNPGAVFGVGAGQRWFFVLFTLGAGAFAMWLFCTWTRPRDWLAHTSLGLVLAGGIGNLYDRLQYACVRDFLHPLAGVELPFGLAWPGGEREVWPWVSNVADALLLIGIVVLLVKLWRTPEGESDVAPDAQGQTAPGAEPSSG
jgi:signal peptidase II